MLTVTPTFGLFCFGFSLVLIWFGFGFNFVWSVKCEVTLQDLL